MRCMKYALLASLAVTCAVLAGGEQKKPPNAREVEVRLTDKSRVRMTILQPSLDIVTKYGTLTIPVEDIRRIEFGIHTSEELAKRIESAIRGLGLPGFQEREAASQELVAIGAPAYLALHKAAKSSDLETANRAKAALARIRQRAPEEQLRVKEDDMIQTAEFTVVGRITAKTIHAATPIFGDTQLNLRDLRSLRSLGSGSDVEMNVEAAKYGINRTVWMETGIEVAAEDDLTITASGQIDLMPNGGGQYISGPNGNMQAQNGTGHPAGALLGRIGETGPTFVIGESYRGTSSREGKLYLQISHSPWGHNPQNPITGAYKVNITGGRDTRDR
jgi:hypothetical protein